MFERFTERARRVVVLAQEEARMLNHDYIGTEHLLLGLIHEGEGVAARALESLGHQPGRRAASRSRRSSAGASTTLSGHIPFTPRAKKVLELSLREALQLGHNYIGTEHILLGLVREGEGVAAQVLVKLGADLSRVRQQVIQLARARRPARPLRLRPAAGEAAARPGRDAARGAHRGLARPAGGDHQPAALDGRHGWPPSSGTWAWRRGARAGRGGRSRAPRVRARARPPEDEGPAAQAGPQGG